MDSLKDQPPHNEETIKELINTTDEQDLAKHDFVFPITSFHVGDIIIPLAQNNKESLLRSKYQWRRLGYAPKDVEKVITPEAEEPEGPEGPETATKIVSSNVDVDVICSQFYYTAVLDDEGYSLSFECLNDKGDILESLKTPNIEPSLSDGAGIPQENPFKSFQRSSSRAQLYSEIQYLQNQVKLTDVGHITSCIQASEKLINLETSSGLQFEISAITKQISSQFHNFFLPFVNEAFTVNRYGSLSYALPIVHRSFSVESEQSHSSEDLSIRKSQRHAHVALKHCNKSDACISADLKESEFSVQYFASIDGKEHFIQRHDEIRWIDDDQRNFIEFSINIDNEGDLEVYGLGERGRLKKNYGKFQMWNEDAYAYEADQDPLYHCYPFVFFARPKSGIFHGLFLDNPSYQVWDFSGNKLKIAALNGLKPFRYYVISGKVPQEIIQNYTFLTGRMSLPAMWVLGYQQCRWSYFPDARVRQIAEKFREKKIPCDVIWLDIDYMQGFRCFTWSVESFPAPEELIQWLHSLNFKVVCMIDPAIKQDPGYWVYDQLMAGRHYCGTPSGKPFVGSVWAGPSVFPDFTRKETLEWWGGLYKGLVELGVDGVWNDMNEPTVFSTEENSVSEWVQHQEGDHRNVHNVYGMLMAKGTYEGLCKLQKDKRPFVLTRAGFSGVQKYGWMWTGDNQSRWEDLALSIPMCLGMGLSGVAGCGMDIGGFALNCVPELYARFIELGTFLPLCRTHSMKGTTDQEPWSFGLEVERISKKYIELRYQLLPYWYTYMWQATQNGTPIMRTMWMEYPGDLACYLPQWEDTQFLVGPHLLVAPVLKKGAITREVYLPLGNKWADFYTHKVFEGGNVVVVDAPLDTLPLFVAEGSVIPVSYKPNRKRYHRTSL